MPAREPSPMILPPQINRNLGGRRAVYLDLNHWIELGRAARGMPTSQPGYPDLLVAARRARDEGSAVFPLSQTHYLEMLTRVASPQRRRNLALLMEELSEIHVLLGRTGIMRLEMEAALDRLQGVPTPEGTVPLLGRSGLWVYGQPGGLRLTRGGLDLTWVVRSQEWFRRFEREMERRLLEGPSDAEAALLRQTSEYNPDALHAIAEKRAEQEREQVARFDVDRDEWRGERIRDAVSARELAGEWINLFSEAVQHRGATFDDLFGPNGDGIREFVEDMPSNSVAISIKTHYHRQRQHNWRFNDIHDIDALSITVPYCDAVFTDAAARHALVTAKVDRRAGTFMPRTPDELATWLDNNTHLPGGRPRP